MSNIVSMEKKFTKELTRIVKNNFKEEKFGASDLAEKMGISRATLHRKLKSTTNKTASQFINEIRLIEANKLLKNRAGTVSKIADFVGFGSSTYFIKCFHKHFGIPPGEILKKNHQTTIQSQEEYKTEKKKPAFPIKQLLWFVFTAIVLLVSSKMAEQFFSQGKNKTAKAPIQNAAAYNLFLQGKNFMEIYSGSGKKEHYLEAKLKFENAIQLDSTFGDAYCDLASIYFSHLPYSFNFNNNQQLFNCYLDSGKVFLEKAEKFNANPDYLLKLNAIFLQRKGNHFEALKLFNKLWENKDKDYN